MSLPLVCRQAATFCQLAGERSEDMVEGLLEAATQLEAMQAEIESGQRHLRNMLAIMSALSLPLNREEYAEYKAAAASLDNTK